MNDRRGQTARKIADNGVKFKRETPAGGRYWIGDVEVSREHWERSFAETFNDQNPPMYRLPDADALVVGLDRIQSLAEELANCHPDVLDQIELATRLRQEVMAARAIVKPQTGPPIPRGRFHR